MAKKRQDFSSSGDEKFTLALALGLEDSPSSPSESAHEEGSGGAVESSDGVDLKAPLRISLERKGHAGKTVTKLSGLTGASVDVQKFSKELKKSLGCGASNEAGVLLFQGDQRERLCDLLKSRGAKNVKSS